MKHEPVKDHAERKRISALIERCGKEQTMRLIDADKLIRKYIDIDIEKFSNSDVKIVLENLKQNILKAPSLEIIRCRDCKYDGTWKCPWRNTQVPRYPSANDFCSYGKRKENK